MIKLEATSSRANDVFAIVWGVMLTLCVTGYTFGQSNHHVYLLEALRIQEPETLARDWFTTHTLQYHFLFTQLVLALGKVRLLHAGFFVLFVVLAVVMHASWLSIVRRVGGGLTAYLLSTLIYHLNAGGLGLGVYQFLQDGAFLPSNISGVATLAAVAFWLARKLWPTAIAVGIAGLFHVNYAIALIGFWGLLSILSLLHDRPRPARREIVRYALATAVAMTPCLYNATVAALGAFSQTAKVPLAEFVAVYVRLRHEHHHDPLHWPIALWISFLWPIPLALAALRWLPPSVAARRLTLLFVLVLALQAFAVVFAGIWYVSDTIVQLSLFRFSIFAKLISCTYAGIWITRIASARQLVIALVLLAAVLLIAVPLRPMLSRSIPQPQIGLLVGAAGLSLALALRFTLPTRPIVWRACIAAGLPVCIVFAAQQRLGVMMPGEDDPDMVELADWASRSTPPRSLFLTPPHDAMFSLAAKRSSVVGFKQVPQLSGEFVEWKRRLDEVLGGDITDLPRPLPRTLDAMADRYARLPSTHLRRVAAAFDCDYLVAMGPLEHGGSFSQLDYVTATQRYYVYRR